MPFALLAAGTCIKTLDLDFCIVAGEEAAVTRLGSVYIFGGQAPVK